jgi:uncharacterized delta-60 repeat protein
VAAATVCAIALPASAKPGDVDPTFGQQGTAWATFRACDCGGNASMRVQPDGKIVVLGATHLVRYLLNGRPDTSFGDRGTVALNIGRASPAGLAIDDAGRIIVVARSTIAELIQIRRWSDRGVADVPFAKRSALALLHQPLHVVGVAEQAVGTARRYIIGGSTATGAFVALAIRADGLLDATFGVGGRAINEGKTYTSADIPIARSMAIEPGNGRIVVAGQEGSNGSETAGNATVARFTARGAPDATFGIGGIAYPTNQYRIIAPTLGLAVAPGGAIYLAGSFRFYRDDDDQSFLVWRLSANGSPDTTFAQQGWNLFEREDAPDPAFPPQAQVVVGDFAQAVVVQPDGKPIVSGSRFIVAYTGSDGSHFYRAQALRLLTNGTPDPSFGTNGWVTGRPGDGRALALHGNRVLLGGDLSTKPPLDYSSVRRPTPPNMPVGLRTTQFTR